MHLGEMAGLNIPCTRGHRQSTERKHLERREVQERKRAGEMSTGTQGDSQYTKNTIIDEHESMQVFYNIN